MKKLFTISSIILVLGLLGGKIHAQNTPLLSMSAFHDSLWVTDTANGWQVQSSMALSFGNFTVTGINGMSIQPGTGTIYVIAKESNNPGNRRLATLDPATGTLTDVGGLGDRFSAITFKDATTLYGVTGDGASTAETLWQINISTASATQLSSLGNGDDGETICYNPSNGFIYHLSGIGTINVDQIFERINSTTFSITNIPLSGYDMSEVFGMTYIGNGEFLCNNITSNWIILNDTGFADTSRTQRATAPDDMRGFGFPLRYVASDNGITQVCSGTPVPMTATDNSATAYQWTLNGSNIAGATSRTYTATQAGTYNCLITIGGVTDSSFVGVTVTVSPGPTVTMGQDTLEILCAGDSISLAGTGTGTNPQWYLNGSPIAGATGFNYTTSTPGQYNLMLTNPANGCMDSSATGTFVDQYVSVGMQITPGGPVDFCQGGSTPLTTTSGGSNYQWFLDGTAITGATMDNVAANAAGLYTVSAEFSGCPDTSVAAVQVNEVLPPMAAFSANPDTVGVGAAIAFTDQSMNASGWNWDFGDLNTSTSQNPSHTYTSIGSYTVTLIAENPPCPADTTTRLVRVNDTMTYVPGPANLVKTIQVYPNPFRSQLNLRFDLTEAGPVEISIYNSLGQKVRDLYSKDLTPGTHLVTWDGKDASGNLTDAGVYIARLKVRDQVMPVRMIRMD